MRGTNKVDRKIHEIYHFNLNQQTFYGYVIATQKVAPKPLLEIAREYIAEFDPACIMSEESLVRQFYTMNQAYIEFRKAT